MDNQIDPPTSHNQKESTPQGSSVNANKSDKNNIDLSKEKRLWKRYQLAKEIAESVEHSIRMGLFKERERETQLKQLFETLKYSKSELFGDDPIGVKLSEVETKPIEWLWQRRIPLGKITILDGDPGTGKSLLAITIAACVSTGQPMPDGAPGKQGKVILIAPEDAAEDTIKPRVEAAGGDPSQVLMIDNMDLLNIKDTKKVKI